MDQSYFHIRMEMLGITPEWNQVNLLQFDSTTNENVLKPMPIFKEHEKGIEIMVYSLDRLPIMIEKEGSKWKKNWSIIRLEKPINTTKGDTIKYLMPKGTGSYPFFPPNLMDAYEREEPVKDLYITEGFFKAFKGYMHGLHIIGLPSITHLKNKDKGELHTDIKKLIKACKVQRVFWLTDGDCFDLSSKVADTKEQVDLYKRPKSFFNSIQQFKDLMDDMDCDKYFAHIDVDSILNEYKEVPKEDVKGLDDLLMSFPEHTEEILEDLRNTAKPGFWFKKYNISAGTSKVLKEFRLSNVNEFFLWHVERKEISQDREFIFNGTKYKYNSDKGECEIMVPGDAKLYFRVGTQYFKFVSVPNQYKQLERQFHAWDKGTIQDDHSKSFLKHIPKYQAFCNVPDHINYQQVINSCFNVYNPLEYQPADEPCTLDDCTSIHSFIRHIFGDSTVHFKHPDTGEKSEVRIIDMALDYIQLLYQKPQQKLPILCLVSKENNTGKSTFGKLLKQILGANCAIVGNQDLAGDFNKHWATKNLVICDETKIDKQAVIEKVKSLSTAAKITMNSKGKDQVELDCFIKFMFITNNEENFIYATEDDIRYWIIKVPVITKENPGLMDNMIEEIPAFLSYLNQRKMVTENLNRMWFHPSLLKTEALKKVIAYSKPTVEKEIIQYVKDAFLDFGITELYMSADDVRKEALNNNSRYERNYVTKILKENFNLDTYHQYKYKTIVASTWEQIFDFCKLDGLSELEASLKVEKIYKVRRYTYPKWMEHVEPGKGSKRVRVEIQGHGRPFIFKREQFLTKEEIASIEISPEDQEINKFTGNSQIPFDSSPNDPI